MGFAALLTATDDDRAPRMQAVASLRSEVSRALKGDPSGLRAARAELTRAATTARDAPRETLHVVDAMLESVRRRFLGEASS